MFDLVQKNKQLLELREKSEIPEFWDNPEKAQSVMKKISALQDELQIWEKLKHLIQANSELAEFDDDSLRPELEEAVEDIEKELARREFDVLLSGPYDSGNALLAVHAGAGGTDSQDWAEMLQRMYLRWAERRGFQSEILDQTEGEEAGIKSVTIAINGRFAYGYLRAEKGVHRLVRLSPYDSNHRRHTSFALIEVLPEIDDVDSEVIVSADDIRIDVFRSSSAGGQNVQKNATAIRITHLPTGLVVQCQNERSQMQNRENAMRVLKARLLEIKREKQEQQISDLRGEYTKAEWGSQIRSYVLHPYQMVKDHRTNYEEGNTNAVLDGSLDNFIEAYLRQPAE